MKEDLDIGSTIKPVGFFKLFRFATKTDVALMIVGGIAAAANGIAQPLLSQFIGNTTDQYSSSADSSQIESNARDQCISMIIVGCASFILSWIQMSFWMISGERQSIECRKQYFKAIIKQEIGWFDLQNPNELTNKISQDCFFLQGAIGEKVPTFLMTIFMTLGGFGVGFWNGWQMSLVASALIPLLILGAFAFTMVLQQSSIKTSEAYLKAGAYSEQSLNAIKTVKSLTGENFEIIQYSQGLVHSFKIATKYAFWSGLGLGLTFLTLYLDYAICFWYGSKLMEDQTINSNFNRRYTQGDIQIIFFAIQMGGFSLGQAAPCLKNLSLGQYAAAKIYSLLDRVPTIKNSPNPKKIDNLQGEIVLKDVEFSYPSKKDLKVHNKLNLTIKPNQKTALVGESGCGKSTVLQLIERFYDPDQGQISIDGQQIKDLDYVWLRNHIGYVGQEPVLFATTIRENLRFGKEDATEEEMINALKQANAWEFIQKLENKLDCFVGNLGSQFSGGQKQRICIARVLLRNPQILLLDEATSALDRKNEAMIQSTLDEISKNRTTIIIAHRLTTVQNADNILVLEKGQLIEQGSYEYLINAGGKFEALAKNQIQKEIEDEKSQRQNAYDEEEEGELIKDTFEDEENALKESTDHARMKVPIEFQDQSIRRATKISQHQVEKVEHGEQGLMDQSVKKQTAVDKQKTDQPEKIKYSSTYIIKKLFEINKAENGYFYLGIIFVAINGAQWPISGLLLGEYFDVLFDPDAPDFRERSDMLTIGFGVLAIVCQFSYLLQNYIFTRVGESLTLRIRKSVYAKMLSMPCYWFDQPENNPGNLNTQLQQDGQYLNQIISSILPTQLSNISCMIVGLIIGFVYTWQMTLVGFIGIPLIIICAKFQAQFIQGFSESTDSAYKESGQIIMESVCNIRTIASFSNENFLHGLISKKLLQPLTLIKKKGQVSGILLGLSFALIFWVYGLVLYCGAVFTQNLDVSPKEMFVAIFSVLFAAFGIGNNMQFMPDIGMAINAANNLLNILNKKDETQMANEQAKLFIKSPQQAENIPAFQGNIEFRNVSFKYPTRDVYVIRNMSFKIQAGQKAAFVGPSGSGKSSVIQLLLRFYDQYEGDIFIDGYNLKQLYNMQEYRKNFGVVSQEPTLFNANIEQNIIYNSEGLNFEQIKKAAQQANALTFIEENQIESDEHADFKPDQKDNLKNLDEKQKTSFGNGFERMVGPKGSKLSGGQKQRIAIARAIIKNPNILLLDEATSALDTQNEQIVQEALDKLMKGKTSICVAHRISTIQDSDQIFVIEQGKLVEQGTYEQLMNKKEYFYRLNSH